MDPGLLHRFVVYKFKLDVARIIRYISDIENKQTIKYHSIFKINIPHYHNQWWNSCAYSLRITMPCNITQISFDIDSRFIQKEDPWNYLVTLSGKLSQNRNFEPEFSI